tara:strand:- start:3 stop:1091 length:1089 start_codon:yes stop_codon:yes gene_type:complete
MKVAIIHYWLNGIRGGERVLENICALYPNADIYTHVLDKSKISDIINRHKIFTTFINYLPLSKKLYKHYIFLMPFALRRLNLSSYDLIISSESGPSKGIIKGQKALHVCYCHSPMRYIWDMSDLYYQSFNFFEKIGYKIFVNYLKSWDIKSSKNIDLIIANSKFVKHRIKNNWNKDSIIINPTIDLKKFTNMNDNGYYIVVSELVEYKKVDLVINAFNKNGKKLIIVGHGPLMNEYINKSKKNIEFKGYVSDNVKNKLLSKSKALIFPGIEDFGIVPLEAMASGKPVIAFNGGGAIEYMKNGENAKLFNEQSSESIIKAINEFELESHNFNSRKILESIKEYTDENFKINFKKQIDRLLSNR